MEERAALLARVSADHGTEIKDPATGEVIGRVAFGTPGDVAAAVDAAAKAQPGRPHRHRRGRQGHREDPRPPEYAAADRLLAARSRLVPGRPARNP
jgi:acyl-CoA reductase-like NAD-dependent aldehyde dehydrogenase